MEFLELYSAVISEVDLYTDSRNKEKIFAEFTNGCGKTVFASVDSMKFQSFLYMRSLDLDDEEKGIDVSRAIKHLKYAVNHNKLPPKVKVNVRVAGDLEDGIEYDLQRGSQKSVKVTQEGWYLSDKEEKFVVPSESLSQVLPVETDKNPLILLKPYINIIGDEFVLFVVWLIHCFCASSHLALVLMAEAGSGKTLATKITRQILDPSDLDAVHFPDRKEDLCVMLAQAFFVCFDNSTTLSKDISDVLCGAITGTAIAKRALYTNNELTVLRLHNTVLINGIDVIPHESDLADRMLVLHMKRIQQNERSTDKDLMKKFKEELPEILGAIFNILSKAMREIGNVDRSNLPRMAEAYVNMLAIAKALGVDERRFRDIFDANVDTLKKERSINPVVEAVLEYMNRNGAKKKEVDMVETLYKKIGSNYSGSSRAIGGSASAFSRKLRQEISTLNALGIHVNFDPTGQNGTKLEIIKK